MDDFDSHLRRMTNITFLFLTISLLIWFIWIDLRPYFAGFILGATVSLINSHYTAWKIRKMSDLVTRSTEQPMRKRVNLGFITRASTSLIAVLIAIRVPDIEFSTTLAGLFLTQVLSLVIGIYVNTRDEGRR